MSARALKGIGLALLGLAGLATCSVVESTRYEGGIPPEAFPIAAAGGLILIADLVGWIVWLRRR